MEAASMIPSVCDTYTQQGTKMVQYKVPTRVQSTK